MVLQRSRVSRLVAVIVIGSLLGGAAGFYLRENINIKERVSLTCDMTERKDHFGCINIAIYNQ